MIKFSCKYEGGKKNMAKLLFFDEEHKYTLDDEVIPSVSEVVRFISREVYGDVNQYMLDMAADRGTKVHKATELLDKYNTVECEEEYIPYVQAYIQWRKDNGIKSENIVEIEKSYGNAEMSYAGTLDRIIKMGDEYWLVDLKTSSSPQKRLWGACLNGYKLLWEAANEGKKISKMMDLQVKKDGTYSVVEIEDNPAVFLACLTLDKEMRSKRKKKKTTEEK